MMIAKHVERLEGYVPGEQPRGSGVVKLNTNENPYEPSPRATEALRALAADRLRRYPDPECGALAAAIAARCGVSPRRVFVGNGSDEILSLCARAFVDDGERIGSLDPSYSLYKTLAAIRDAEWRGCPAPDAAAAKRLAADENVSLFLWTNPNAPTGAFAEPQAIADFAAAFPGVTLVDEAYADFARDNCMRLAAAPDNRNTIVMRTFSKSWSLAGLRVGYCIGPEELIAALYKIKDSYNVDAVAQAVAAAAYSDEAWHRETVAKVVEGRERLAAELRARGWDVPHSEANFLFAKPPSPSAAEDVFRGLRGRNVFVRWFAAANTRDRLRITVGTPEQNAAFLAAADAVCAACRA